MKNQKKEIRRTSIGGQALFEGIMMRGVGKAAMAVRQKSGDLIVEEWEIKKGKWYQRTPFIRGIFNFIIQMSDGYKYMTRSAELSGMMEEEEGGEESSKFEKWLEEKFGDKLSDVIMGIGLFMGVAMALLLFMFLPTWIFTGIQSLFANFDLQNLRSLLEGILKIIIFILYMWATSKMSDIKRTYEYHGAEHKTIACYEAGDELTPEKVSGYTRFHCRCGTSFIFLTLTVSILVYSIVPINSEFLAGVFGVGKFFADFLRVVFKIILLPVTVGISYELIRWAGQNDNVLTKIISAPGLALQRLTTKEPSLEQIEVAIAALKPVLPMSST